MARSRADWTDLNLGEVVALTGGALQTGPFGSQLHAGDYVPDGTPLIMPVNIGDNTISDRGIARVADHDVRRLRRHVLREGDIVFGRRGEVGRRSIVRREQAGWLCGTGCLAARFGNDLTKVDPEFVAMYLGLPQVQRWFADNAVGGTMPNLNTSILAAARLRLPDRGEQTEIVRVLTTPSRFASALHRAINKKEDIRAGLMQELLTAKSRLPGFSSEWERRAMGSLGDVYGGLTGKSKDDFGVGHARYVPFMAVMSNVRVTGEALPAVRVAKGERQREVFDGDVLFNTSSETPDELAMAAVACGLPRGTYLNSFCFGLRLSPEAAVDPLFLAYTFRSGVGRAKLSSLAQGATRYNLSRAQFRRIELLLPALEEQQAIVSVLGDADHELHALRRRLAKAREIKQGLMQELLTGRTRLPIEEPEELAA